MAGVCVPLKCIPLFREDAATGNVTVAVEMRETAEILMNPVNLRITPWFVPNLAFERFEKSIDQFNRSYKGQKKTDDPGAVVVPFVETHAYGAYNESEFYGKLGLHAKSTDQVNTAYLEAYNLVWNYRAANKSPKITPRARLDRTLAPAFWEGGRFDGIVPKFDSATMEGEVALNVTNARMPVKGFGIAGGSATIGSASVYETDGGGGPRNFAAAFRASDSGVAYIEAGGVNGLPQIFAELQQNGITVSLANIDLARKTQAFAKLREQYAEHDDDWIIDMLMDGIHIPDLMQTQPMPCGRSVLTKFGMAKRYQSAGDLTESAVSGAAMANVRYRVPKTNTGGVIIFIAEISPEPLWERQRDAYFHSDNSDVISETGSWPQWLRDTLDPEKVAVVPNGFMDTDHNNPNGTFGYWELNGEWKRMGPNVGGKFSRPTAATGFDEDRQRIWAAETANPQLAEAFYLVKDLNHKPFLDAITDTFEFTVLGGVSIQGNTVFGPPLIEAMNNYEKVLEKAPVERIEQEA